MHRDEVDRRIIFDQRLGTVAVMDVPVDDQHPFCAVFPPRVVRRDGCVTEQAEAHRAIVQRVVARGPHRTEAAHILGKGEIDRVEGATGAGTRGVPRPIADDRIVVEPSAT